jgi:hypothetical protein
LENTYELEQDYPSLVQKIYRDHMIDKTSNEAECDLKQTKLKDLKSELTSAYWLHSITE